MLVVTPKLIGEYLQVVQLVLRQDFRLDIIDSFLESTKTWRGIDATDNIVHVIEMTVDAIEILVHVIIHVIDVTVHANEVTVHAIETTVQTIDRMTVRAIEKLVHDIVQVIEAAMNELQTGLSIVTLNAISKLHTELLIVDRSCEGSSS